MAVQFTRRQFLQSSSGLASLTALSALSVPARGRAESEAVPTQAEYDAVLKRLTNGDPIDIKEIPKNSSMTVLLAKHCMDLLIERKSPRIS